MQLTDPGPQLSRLVLGGRRLDFQVSRHATEVRDRDIRIARSHSTSRSRLTDSRHRQLDESLMSLAGQVDGTRWRAIAGHDTGSLAFDSRPSMSTARSSTRSPAGRIRNGTSSDEVGRRPSGTSRSYRPSAELWAMVQSRRSDAVLKLLKRPHGRVWLNNLG